MFNFFRKSREPQPPSAAIASALGLNGSTGGTDLSGLAVVARRGSYSGRPVRYFRVFSPKDIGARGVSVRVFADLDGHPNLVVGSGHVERDGAVVVSARARPTATDTPGRSSADRASHADDEHYVFPDGRA
jgi:hypothetical protein